MTKEKTKQGKVGSKAPGLQMAPPPAAPSGPIVMNEEERQQILALDANLARTKVALADVDLEFARIEAMRNEARAAVLRANEALSECVINAGKAHGVDLRQGQWHFDTKTMTLTKRLPPQ